MHVDLTSKEFVAEAIQNRAGKHAAKRTICFGGVRKNSATGEREPYCLKRWNKYRAEGFDRIRNAVP